MESSDRQSDICLRLGSEKDAPEVLEIYKTAPDYFRKVDGCEPSLETARTEITIRSDYPSPRYFKEFLIIEYKGQSIGTVDLHCNPDTGVTYLGLLFISGPMQGKGLGRKCYELVEDRVRSFGSKILRLGVSEANDVSGFWEAMGFSPNGKTYDWKGESKTTLVTEYEKKL